MDGKEEAERIEGGWVASHEDSPLGPKRTRGLRPPVFSSNEGIFSKPINISAKLHH